MLDGNLYIYHDDAHFRLKLAQLEVFRSDGSELDYLRMNGAEEASRVEQEALKKIIKENRHRVTVEVTYKLGEEMASRACGCYVNGSQIKVQDDQALSIYVEGKLWSQMFVS